MSVYIRGMEMPKEGTVITVYKIDGKLYATRGLSGRLFPLVPVPLHGNLKDADALLKEIANDAIWKHDAINEYDSGIRMGARTIMRLIRNASTIIPAELPVHHGTFAAASEKEALERIIPAEEGE